MYSYDDDYDRNEWKIDWWDDDPDDFNDYWCETHTVDDDDDNN